MPIQILFLLVLVVATLIYIACSKRGTLAAGLMSFISGPLVALCVLLPWGTLSDEGPRTRGDFGVGDIPWTAWTGLNCSFHGFPIALLALLASVIAVCCWRPLPFLVSVEGHEQRTGSLTLMRRGASAAALMFWVAAALSVFDLSRSMWCGASDQRASNVSKEFGLVMTCAFTINGGVWSLILRGEIPRARRGQATC